MRLQLHDIIPILSPYIKTVCTMDCDDDADTRHIRVLPDTCVELFVNYSREPVAMIEAVCFYPGMAYQFFHVPMNLLSDRTIALSDLWDGLAAELEDKLAGLCSNEDRVKTVQKYLIQQFASDRRDLQVDYCLNQVRRSSTSISVGKLSAEIGLSQRQLLRSFQERIGLSPKEYLRVSRFTHSLQYLKRYPHISLTEVACQSGYYDQSHFIRDYKEYTGYSPSEVINAQDILF
jgi:AraC-like DNA-binding protein